MLTEVELDEAESWRSPLSQGPCLMVVDYTQTSTYTLEANLEFFTKQHLLDTQIFIYLPAVFDLLWTERATSR